MDSLSQLFAYLLLVSVAAERFTDILKRGFLEKLVSNGVVYQLVSGSFGAFIAYAMPLDGLLSRLPLWVAVLIVGLCVSGGSSVWNTVVTTLAELSKNIQDLKKTN